MKNRKASNMMKTTMAVTIVVFISKLGGFVRDMITAAYFGTTMANDAYVSAYSLFNIPVLLFNSMITSTMVPMYMQISRRQSLKRADRFASNTINLVAIGSLILSMLMMLLADPLVRLVYPGYAAVPGKVDLTAELTRLMMPGLVFFVITIVISTILNARDRFMAAQLTGLPLSFSLILATVLFSNQYGIRAVAFGVVVAGVLQLIMLAPFLKSFFRYTLYVKLRDPYIKRLIRLSIPALLSMAINEINHLIDVAIGSGLGDGAVSSMNYSFRLITFVLGVLLVPLTTIVFSKMSEHAVDRDRKGVIKIVGQCIEIITLAILPIVVVSLCMSDDVIRLVYKRGTFDEASVISTSSAFFFYMAGVLAFGLRDLFNRVFHSFQDTATPMLISMVSLLLNLVLNLILVRFMGVGGLALATSISGFVAAALLLYIIRKRFGKIGFWNIADQLVRILFAGALSVATCLIVSDLIVAPKTATWSFIRLAVSTMATFTVYLGATWLLRVRQLDVLAGMIKR